MNFSFVMPNNIWDSRTASPAEKKRFIPILTHHAPALNALKLEDRKKKNTDVETVISIASWKRLKSNQHLMCRVFSALGLSLNDEKVIDTYEQLSSYGAIAA